MTVYLIVPTEDPEDLARRVKDAFQEKDRFMLDGGFASAVSTDETARLIARRLDLDGVKTGRACPAVITRVTTYGGFAPTALWEWLSERTL